MADFFTRLVSRTLSGLEPTVKPLIVPMYASGAKMADNYAVDPAPELGLSVSEKYASTESPIERSPKLLGISAAETLSLASNITPINWEKIQLPNNPSEITSSKQLGSDRAIAPETPIASSITPPSTIQKSSNQETVNLNPTIQPLDNSSEIASGEQLESDRAIAPENSIEASPPSETIQPLDNSSEIASGEQIESDRAIAPVSSIEASPPEKSSPPITPSIAPSNVIQKLSSQDTVNVTPTPLETIKPLEKPSEISSGGQLESDRAIAPENSIKASPPEKSSPPISPSIAPSNVIQKSTSAEVNSASNSIQPASKSGIERSPTLRKTANQPPSRLVESQVADVNKNSSLDNTSASSSPISKLASQLSSNQNSETENAIAEESSLLQLNNQSSPERAKKVSLPLVRSEVIAPFSSLPLNPSGQVEPPVNKVESIQSIEINSASESNIPAASGSLPQSDLADTGLSPPSSPSTSSSPSPKSSSSKNAVKNLIFPLVQSGEARIMRSPNASETVSRSPGSSEIKTGAIEPQNTSFTTSLPQPSNSQEISSADTMTPIPFIKGELKSQLLTDTSPNKSMTTVTNSQNFSSQEDKTSNPSRLAITTQSNLIAEGVQSRQFSESESERIDSNPSSADNSLSSPGEKVLARREVDLLEIARLKPRQTESIPFKIEPRLERQELPQSPEQLSELPFPAKSQFSPSRQLSQTEGLKTTSGSPRKITNANAESTPTINITIGRVEVRGIKSPEPPPIKKLRSKTPQLSLCDYLNQRGGISP